MTVKTRRLSRRAQRVGVIATVAAALFTATAAQAADVRTVTDDYLFSKSLSEFTQIRAQHPYANQLDWSSDNCSYSPDKPLGYDFTGACNRHDFGYRNYKKQARFTEAGRKQIDDRFYSDMGTICVGSVKCSFAAWTYYQAVRAFGG